MAKTEFRLKKYTFVVDKKIVGERSVVQQKDSTGYWLPLPACAELVYLKDEKDMLFYD